MSTSWEPLLSIYRNKQEFLCRVESAAIRDRAEAAANEESITSG
jgi:hypothetical protein